MCTYKLSIAWYKCIFVLVLSNSTIDIGIGYFVHFKSEGFKLKVIKLYQIASVLL